MLYTYGNACLYYVYSHLRCILIITVYIALYVLYNVFHFIYPMYFNRYATALLYILVQAYGSILAIFFPQLDFSKAGTRMDLLDSKSGVQP